jgi:hypothetical protein
VLIDEADVLSEKDAEMVWNKMMARARQKKPDGAVNTVACVSTPEGFKWLYRTFEKEKKPGYELIRAPTSSNPYLPTGYMDQLRAAYSPNLLLAYTEGFFVNLTAGSVYAEFDRTLNATSETVQPGDTLHIGMDFNVAHGAAVVHVLRGDDPHAVNEFTEVFDTPAMIALIKRDYPGHAVMIYPDASGGNRKSNNASESDLSLLKAAGFRVCVNPANPAVKDRVLSSNAMIHRGGVRRYRVNPEKCPQLVESLEKQAYDKHGEPDKSGGLDHIIDAATYFIAYRWPLTGRFTPPARLGFASNG